MPTRTAWPGGPAAAKDTSKASAAVAPSNRGIPRFMLSAVFGSADRGGDRGAEILGAGIAAEIGGAGAALGQDFRNSPFHRRGRVCLAEMLEHHRARPDLPDRIGDAAPGDVRRRDLHRRDYRWES